MSARRPRAPAGAHSPARAALPLLRKVADVPAELEELVPSPLPLRDMVKIGYHVRRGEHQPALELGARFVEEHPARSVIGWAAAYASYAAALNHSERYAEASELCTRALAALTPDDLEYVIMYGPLVREFAVARAGCGDLARALQIADEFSQRLSQHGEFALLAHAHEARAFTARMVGDQELLKDALQAMREAAERAGSSSVLDQAARIMQTSLRAGGDEAPPAAAEGADELSSFKPTARASVSRGAAPSDRPRPSTSRSTNRSAR